MVWSASEDGTLRQHDFREGASCPPAGASHQECRNVLVNAEIEQFGWWYCFRNSCSTYSIGGLSTERIRSRYHYRINISG